MKFMKTGQKEGLEVRKKVTTLLPDSEQKPWYKS